MLTLSTAVQGSLPPGWGLFLQYAAAPVLVAIAGLVTIFVQNWQNNDREDKRRADDAAEREKDRRERERDRDERATQAQVERDHQRQLAETERQSRHDDVVEAHKHELALARVTRARELAERWRDERRIAHVALLAVFRSAGEAIRKAANALKYDEDGKPIVPQAGQNPLSDGALSELQQAVAEVQVIGSENSRDSANTCHACLQRADVMIWISTESEMPDSHFSRDKIEEARRATLEAIDRYLDDVRSDLGTAG